MSKPVTIELDDEVLARASLVAETRGIATEEYLRAVIAANVPVEVAPSRQQFYLAKIIGMGNSSEPTDIAKDKDKLLDEAAWAEHLRETAQE
jgi:hypothetical protein